MAMRLLDASFTLNVWNRSPAKTINANKAGAVVASCPSVVASRSEIIISMLNDDDAALEVFEGADGLLAGNVEDNFSLK